jgi:hypothetical protein
MAGSSARRTSPLDAWIDALRDRLAHGDLTGLGPIDLNGTGHLPGEIVIRIMLSDLDDLDDPAGSWGHDAAWRAERRWHLLRDFRRLREILG